MVLQPSADLPPHAEVTLAALLLEKVHRDREYHHSNIWRAQIFFTTAIGALLGANVALLAAQGVSPSARMSGALVLLVLAMGFAHVGRATTQELSGFMLKAVFLESRFGRDLARKTFDADLIDKNRWPSFLSDFDEYYDAADLPDLKAFLGKAMNGKKGVRFQFRIMFGFYAILAYLLGMIVIGTGSDLGGPRFVAFAGWLMLGYAFIKPHKPDLSVLFSRQFIKVIRGSK